MARVGATFDALDFIPYGLQSAIIDGTSTADVTTYLQDALTSERTVQLGQGRRYNIEDTLTVSGSRYLRGDFTILKSQISDATKPMIANSGGTSLRISGIRFQGDNTAIKLRTVGSAGLTTGLKLIATACRFEAATPTYPAVWFRQADFVEMNDIDILNYDEGVRIEGYPDESDRANTQIILRNFNISGVNLGLYARYVRDLRVDNFDLNRCAAGFFFVGDNERILVNQGHVEGLGYSGLSKTVDGVDITGDGFHIADGAQQRYVKLNQCDTLLMADRSLNARRSLYQGGTSRSVGTQVVAEYCSFALSNPDNFTYYPMEIRGEFHWKGHWPFTSQIITFGSSTFSNSFLDIVIDTGPNGTRYVGDNLLSSSDPSALPSTSGTVSWGVTGDGILENDHLLTLAADAEAYEVLTLSVGWYTMVFSGYQKTGVPLASVRKDSDTSDRQLFTQFLYSSLDYERVFRIPFRINTVGDYRVGFRAVTGSATAGIGRVMVVKGFYSGRDIPA